MDMLEAIATPRVRQFIFHLMERIEEDEYPSIPMMQRPAADRGLRRLTALSRHLPADHRPVLAMVCAISGLRIR